MALTTVTASFCFVSCLRLQSAADTAPRILQKQELIDQHTSEETRRNRATTLPIILKTNANQKTINANGLMHMSLEYGFKSCVGPKNK
jgi:hypothetical protein